MWNRIVTNLQKWEAGETHGGLTFVLCSESVSPLRVTKLQSLGQFEEGTKVLVEDRKWPAPLSRVIGKLLQKRRVIGKWHKCSKPPHWFANVTEAKSIGVLVHSCPRNVSIIDLKRNWNNAGKPLCTSRNVHRHTSRSSLHREGRWLRLSSQLLNNRIFYGKVLCRHYLLVPTTFMLVLQLFLWRL